MVVSPLKNLGMHSAGALHSSSVLGWPLRERLAHGAAQLAFGAVGPQDQSCPILFHLMSFEIFLSIIGLFGWLSHRKL